MAKPKKRERIGHRGPFVTIANHATLLMWRDVYGVPLGYSLDAIIEHCREDPRFRLPVKNARKGLMVNAGKTQVVPAIDT